MLVVNNGDGEYADIQSQLDKEIDWVDAGRNLGWMKAINLALDRTDTPLFCMMNDDVFFPPGNIGFWDKLAKWFAVPHVGGVGPTSNFVAGWQNMKHLINDPAIFIPFLIGFCAVYRTKDLRDMGGLDADLPGGDDFDLSIRMRQAGYDLVCNRECFLFHIGQQTGGRVQGSYWDSTQHQSATYNALIRKHGLPAWYDAACGPFWTCKLRVGHMASMTIEEIYHANTVIPSDVHMLLGLLRGAAEGCKHVTEFGTKDCTTTSAFLAAGAKVVSYDIERCPEVDAIKALCNGNFEFHMQSTLEANIEPTEILFIDDLHTYAHVKRELDLHADKVSKLIFFHDTESFGWRGEGGGPGIRPAIDEFRLQHPEWEMVLDTEKSYGLLGLRKA